MSELNERYEGKPMLRLLECYVLKAIGELSEESARNLKAMEPKMAEAYGTQGTWDEVIAKEMGLPDTMPGLILQKWNHIQAIARREGEPLTGQQFAELFVDSNLV